MYLCKCIPYHIAGIVTHAKPPGPISILPHLWHLCNTLNMRNTLIACFRPLPVLNVLNVRKPSLEPLLMKTVTICINTGQFERTMPYKYAHISQEEIQT